MSYDLLHKLILVGDVSSGKTALMNRFCNGSYGSEYNSTIGIDFKVGFLNIDDKKIKLQIWDTAGQERFKAIVRIYYRSTNAVLLIFDLSRPETLQTLHEWLLDVQKFGSKNSACLLVGCKSDLPSKIDDQDIIDFSQQYGIPWIKCSAKTGDNVNEVFIKIAEQLNHTDSVTVNLPSNTVLNHNLKLSKKKCC